MDSFPAVKELQARKRDLLLESEINRQILRLECGRVRYRAESWRNKWASAQGVWKWAAPVAGFLFARKFNKTTGAFTAVTGLIPTLRKLWETWRERQRRGDE